MLVTRALLLVLVVTAFALGGLLLAGSASTTLAAATPPETASHEIYNPARIALVNARRQLAESARQEQEILERVKRAHRELDASLALLASAGQLDPAMQAPIARVRASLAKLQDNPALCPMDSASALSAYKQILDDLQALIAQY